MYVESSTSCNDLSFQLGSASTTATRSWSIKVTQYSCAYDNLAPEGCTQYFFGANTDVVQTYNWDGSHHIASQNQVICVRWVEDGLYNCLIEYLYALGGH